MKSKFLKFIILEVVLVISAVIISYAAQIDPSIPSFNPAGLSLSSDGTARFAVPAYSGKWKRFDIQLLVRQSTFPVGATTPVYQYKESGSIKHVEPTDTEYTFNFTKEGYYQFQIRGVNLEGNYGNWAMIADASAWPTYEGVAVTKDDISPGGGNSGSASGIGSGTNYNYGPGVVQYGSYPYGNQYYVIGPNGEILYNYGGNQSYNYYGNQQYAGMGIAQGPGYVNNYAGGSTILQPNTGISSYPVAPAPNVNSMYGYDTNYFPNTNQGGASSQTNPNYYNGGAGYQGGSANNAVNSGGSVNGTPQITQGLEVGWHVDGNGRFYYQGNGSVLRGTWYFIDGSYYRFSDNGYTLANQWFKDNATGYWYFLAGDGRMVTGWQNINGVWYYFKPENGNGYGAMYSNTSIPISDAKYGTGFYAFDSNGANIMNAWFGGYYYGSDGKRTT